MKATWIVLGVLAAIALVAVGVIGAGVGAYNSLNQERNAVDAQSKQVDVQYQRAFRLVPQLINLTNTYMANERDIQIGVAALRSGLSTAQNGTLNDRDNFTGVQLPQFLALLPRSENYPNLKADALFQQLEDEITNTENKIASEKVRYNDDVQAYNTHRTTCCLPLFVANSFGFHAAEYIGFTDRPNQQAFPANTSI